MGLVERLSEETEGSKVILTKGNAKGLAGGGVGAGVIGRDGKMKQKEGLGEKAESENSGGHEMSEIPWANSHEDTKWVTGCLREDHKFGHGRT